MANVPHGDIVTALTFAESPVSNAHLPAFFLPQNHVLAYLSSLCAVTTDSHPVVPDSVASPAKRERW